jgi:S-methylmethionine-dependent homocysteine/selenocysteine methylase
MPEQNFTDRLAAGHRLLMDGGTGSELQRRGIDVLQGATAQRLGAWSGPANIDAPDAVSEVHRDYLNVGADIIISNSFWTNRHRLAPIGLGDDWERYARAAGRIAVEARDDRNPAAYVAGGIATPCIESALPGPEGNPRSDTELLGRDEVQRMFSEVATVLADEGVDVILTEYIGHVDDAVAAIGGASEAGLPVVLGMRHVTLDGTLQYGTSFDDLADALADTGVAAVTLMCSQPEEISASLPNLREAFDGPIGAYSQIGYQPIAPLGGLDTENPLPDNENDPARLVEFAADWQSMGAQIIGGCCATTPAHIEAMRAILD